MKFFFGIVAVLFLTALPICAAPSPFSFYAQAGFGLLVSKGDFNDRALVVKDEDGNKGNLHPATMKVLGSYNLGLGLDYKNFSLAFDFQHWNSEQNLTSYVDQTLERNTRLSRFDLEISYNFFWPEFFQPGIGVGASLTSIKTKDNLFYGADTYDVDFSGFAFGIIGHIRYFLTDHIAMVPAIKIYENCVLETDADRLDEDSINHHLWQTFILVNLAVQYHF